MRYSDLLKRLKPYGVKVKEGGKGSETILHRPPEGSERGPQYTIKKHGDNPKLIGGSSKPCSTLLGSLKELFGLNNSSQQVLVVLRQGPVDSPQGAVRVATMAESRGQAVK